MDIFFGVLAVITFLLGMYFMYDIGLKRGIELGVRYTLDEFQTKYDGWAFLDPDSFYSIMGVSVEEYKALYRNPEPSKDTKKPDLKVIKKDDS